jgi:hypothetical protein
MHNASSTIEGRNYGAINATIRIKYVLLRYGTFANILL